MKGYFCSSAESGPSLCRDIHSRIYYDYDDKRFVGGPWEDVQNAQNNSLRCAVSSGELEERAESQRKGGLENWTYDNPFAEVSVQVDDVNDLLESRFLKDAHIILKMK